MDTTPKQGPDVLTLIVDRTRRDNRELLAAVSGKRILVYGWVLTPDEDSLLGLLSASTPLTGEAPTYAGCEWRVAVQAEPYVQTVAGEALRLLCGAVSVRGTIWYRQQ